MKIRRKESRRRCVYCHDVGHLESWCNGCEAEFHIDCIRELKYKCPTFGCRSAIEYGPDRIIIKLQEYQNETERRHLLAERYGMWLLVPLNIGMMLVADPMAVGACLIVSFTILAMLLVYYAR